mmetsp:Transcript_10973/g.23219  ORF Transcript_10973/g.23219 Transcript_10973/m.23219 type:complete len:238 (-) Transcript_10973:351-1064(-)
MSNARGERNAPAAFASQFPRPSPLCANPFKINRTKWRPPTTTAGSNLMHPKTFLLPLRKGNLVVEVATSGRQVRRVAHVAVVAESASPPSVCRLTARSELLCLPPSALDNLLVPVKAAVVARCAPSLTTKPCTRSALVGVGRTATARKDGFLFLAVVTPRLGPIASSTTTGTVTTDGCVVVMVELKQLMLSAPRLSATANGPPRMAVTGTATTVQAALVSFRVAAIPSVTPGFIDGT